jgi:hypothetical protein
MATVSDSQMSARLGIVEKHVRSENEHNLDGIMQTFGATACYDDESWGAHLRWVTMKSGPSTASCYGHCRTCASTFCAGMGLATLSSWRSS